MSVRKIDLDKALSDNFKLVFASIEAVTPTPKSITVAWLTPDRTDGGSLNLNLEDGRFDDDELEKLCCILHVGSSLKRSFKANMQMKARAIAEFYSEQMAHDGMNSARIIQLAANRARLEAQIADINRELNELLKPEIERMTY